MTPPFAAVVAFAILFGHPILQMILIGAGARAFAITPLGRIATYGSAAAAGALVALTMRPSLPAAPRQAPPIERTESKPAPTEQVPFRTLRREDEPAPAEGPAEGVVEGPARAPEATRWIAEQPGAATAGGDIVAAKVGFSRTEIDELVSILGAASLLVSAATRPNPSVVEPERNPSADLKRLRDISAKLQAVRRLLDESRSSEAYVSTDAPAPNFTRGIEQGSGVPHRGDGAE